MRVEIPDRGRFDSGRLTVAEAGDGQSGVTVHLSFGPRSVGDLAVMCGTRGPTEADGSAAVG